MQVSTSRFGGLRIEEGDVFLFPRGLIGLEEHRQWVLLGDSANDAVGWLQSTTSAELAVAVISPRRFIPQYRVHIARRELVPLQLNDVDGGVRAEYRHQRQRPADGQSPGTAVV